MLSIPHLEPAHQLVNGANATEEPSEDFRFELLGALFCGTAIPTALRALNPLYAALLCNEALDGQRCHTP